MLAGFAVLAVTSLGLFLVTAATPLWLIAAILACRSVSIGLVINPLLQAMTEPLRPRAARRREHAVQHRAADRRIVRNRLARRPVRDPGPCLRPGLALHLVCVVLAMIAATGVLAALALPAVRNTALAR